MLTAGAPADLIVVDVDPLTASPETVAETRVLLTVVDGRVTHAASLPA